MGAIVGLVSCKNLIGKNVENIFKVNAMLQAVRHRGSGYDDTYVSDCAIMAQAQLATDGSTESIVTRTVEGREYTIVFDGAIFNKDELNFKLASLGALQGQTDAEVVLLSYIAFGTDCSKELNGVFAFMIYDNAKEQYFMARDHFGVKPLFYTLANGFLLFASEIKGLFASGLIQKKISGNGYAEIFGLAPSRTAGECIYKDISELRPAECAIYNRSGLITWEYWHIQADEHKDNLEDTIEKVKALVFDAIERQTTQDTCAFLSGGLDSSIIAAIAAKKIEHYGRRLSTYSIDYEGNEQFFQKTAYQPDSDQTFALLMAEYCNSIHTSYIADSGMNLAASVVHAAYARDLPGMADVDGSLLFFCKQIAKHYKVALSGECADEIFAGYPWYINKTGFDTFPWMNKNNMRASILNQEFAKKYQINEYIAERYAQSVARAPILDVDDTQTATFRRLQYLNIYWFMATLLERSSMMSAFAGLEIRVPFCDFNIVQYLYNIPPKVKLLDNREKGLLRRAVSKLLPDAIIDRKKSPYPKTFNPHYEKTVKALLKCVLKKDSILKDAIDLNKLECLFTACSDYGTPWFGQLMSTPQLYGYLLQIHCLFDNI